MVAHRVLLTMILINQSMDDDDDAGSYFKLRQRRQSDLKTGGRGSRFKNCWL